MMTVTFACGHERSVTGGETDLACGCGETRIAAVDAPLPRFTGHVTGPHAQFKNLEPTAVTLGAKTNG